VIPWHPSHLIAAAVLDEQPGDRTVAEVEHEARPLVAVIEEIRLTARGDDQDRAQLVLGQQHVAGETQRHRFRGAVNT
jgi:hypothetical protein